MSKSLDLRPRLSEKTYGLAEKRVYVVEVPLETNKHSVARAVEAQFEVKVSKINILNVGGKSKRVFSLSGKRVRNTSGKRNDIKKAYVTLADGFSLPFFAVVEEETEKEQASQEKFDKAAAKQTVKQDNKPARRGLLKGRRSGGARGGDK